MRSATDLVSKVTELVSFPDVAIQVNDMLSDEHSDASAIGAVIEQDPALTATLLKLANSSMYGPTSGDVDSVAKAFTRIGAREIQCGTVINRSSDDRQAQCRIDRIMKPNVFQHRQTLIVIHRQHSVRVGETGFGKQCVCRVGSAQI